MASFYKDEETQFYCSSNTENVTTVKYNLVVISKGNTEEPSDIKDFISLHTEEEQQGFQVTEKLCLQLQKHVHVLENIILKKQKQIKRLSLELERERSFNMKVNENLRRSTESVIELYSEIDNIVHDLKKNCFDDTQEKSSKNVFHDNSLIKLNQLSTELQNRFDDCSDQNIKIKEEMAYMNELLEKLEGYLTGNVAVTDTNNFVKCSNGAEFICQKNDTNKIFNERFHITEQYPQQDKLAIEKHGIDQSKVNTKYSVYCMCGKGFGLMTTFKEHVKYYTMDWKFSCDMCLEKFRGAGYLRKHLEAVHNVKKELASMFGCRECGQMFKTKLDLFAHQKFVHQQGRKKQVDKDEFLLSTLFNENQINSEMLFGKDGRFHGKDKSKAHIGYFCICGSKYRHKSSLSMHIRILTSENKFSCKTCDRKFFGANLLRQHMIQTHKVQPGNYLPSYGCRRCGKLFRNFAQLIKHRRVDHSFRSEKKAEKVINYKTKRKQVEQVESEILDHHDFANSTSVNGSKSRFLCTCGRTFSTKKQLSQHISAKTRGKIFKCSLCSSAM